MRRSTRIALRRTAWRTVYWLVLPILFLLAVRLFWGYHAERRLSRARATLLEAAHSLRPTASTTQTASQVLDLAFAQRKVDPDEAKFLKGDDKELDSAGEIAWTPAENERIRTIIESNRALLERIDALTSHPLALAPMHRIDEAPISRHTDQLAYLQQLLEHSACLSFEDHRVDDALHSLCELLVLADLADDFNEWADFRLRNRASACLERFETQLQLDSPKAAAEAQRLIILLLDDSRAVQDKFFWINGHLELDTVTFQYPGWWAVPYQREGFANLLEHAADVLPAFDAANYQEARTVLKRYPDFSRIKSDFVALLEDVENSVGDSPMIDLRFRTQTNGRATAMLLAARLYEAQIGHPPAHAAELVPHFLPAIPNDPLAAGQLLHYRLDPAGPTVWSTGEDGIDNGGTVVQLAPNGKRKSRFPQQPDAMYGAAWRTAAAPASTKAAAPIPPR